MDRRTLGATGVELSPLAFGSMRMEVYSAPDNHWKRLLLMLLDEGVTTFHSSREYESYPRFCRVLRQLRRSRPHAQIQHIVKVAAPDFNEPAFRASMFRARIESELQNLGADRLDVVQWLVRRTPNSDGPRLAVFREALPDFAAEWQRLRAEGKVGALTSFPYTPGFAEEMLRLEICNGLTTYLNPAELEYTAGLDEMLGRGQGFIALRPLFGGKVFALKTADGRPLSAVSGDATSGGPAQFCLRFPLLHPSVASAVLSISSITHAEEAIAAAGSVPLNAAEFHRLRKLLAERTDRAGR